MTGPTDIADRIVRLDREPDNPIPPGNHHPDIDHFIQVMSRVTDTGDPPVLLSASRSDEMVAECALLDRLEKIAPQIVTGPLAIDTQVWIGTGKPSHIPPGGRRLSQHLFIPVSADIPASTKPFGAGLFTSTCTLGGASMWRAYLDRHEMLFPLPWWTWSVTVEPDIAVYEITSATRWVELVSTWSRSYGGRRYPDWAAIAGHYDAIHVTTRAIAAAQGFCYPTPAGPIAAPYWDVESTFWLRWRIASATLIERQPAESPTTPAPSGTVSTGATDFASEADQQP